MHSKITPLPVGFRGAGIAGLAVVQLVACTMPDGAIGDGPGDTAADSADAAPSAPTPPPPPPPADAGPPPEPELVTINGPSVLRVNEIALRDPRPILNVGLPADVTDVFNGQLANANNGIEDFSLVLALNAPAQDAPAATAELVDARCSTPLSSAPCRARQVALAGPVEFRTADCPTPVEGTTAKYTPPAAPTKPPCLVVRSPTATLNLLDMRVALRDVTLSATVRQDNTLSSGLIAGFWPQSEVEQVAVPEGFLGDGIDIEGLGAINLLPKAQRDTLADGTLGWWMYFHIDARQKATLEGFPPALP
jgi:hypothetical protein